MDVPDIATAQAPRIDVLVPRGLRGRPAEPWLPWVLAITVAVLVLYPLGMVVYSSFRTSPPGSAGALTAEPWIRTMSNPESLSALLSTFRIVIPKVILAMTVATLFSWILARTNTPGRPVLIGLLAFMFFVPN